MPEKIKIIKIDLDNVLEASVARLEELRKGRKIGDIPIRDEYWKALRKHRLSHGAKL